MGPCGQVLPAIWHVNAKSSPWLLYLQILYKVLKFTPTYKPPTSHLEALYTVRRLHTKPHARPDTVPTQHPLHMSYHTVAKISRY